MSDESKISRPGQQDEDVEAHGKMEGKAESKMGVTEDENDEVEAHARFDGKTDGKADGKMD